MRPEEIREHLRPVAEKLKTDALDSGSWYSYRNEFCTDDNMFIHEFKDGRKELIRLGNQTGQFTVLKTFI